MAAGPLRPVSADVHGQNTDNPQPSLSLVAETMVKHRLSYSRRGEQAIQAFHEADIYDAIPRLGDGDDAAYSSMARHERAKAEVLLEPTAPVAVGCGEAISWEHKSEEPYLGAHARIVDTLEHPNTVAVGASRDRMSAAVGAGVLEPAIDAVMAAQARNSIEKMLCHQLAAAHHSAMRLIERSIDPDLRLQPADVVRFTNASARMMDIYQAGCLALLKMKTQGTQRVVVQHVNVGPGGQAVVAGHVDRGSRERGEVKKRE